MAEHRALTHAADDAGGADALDQRFEKGVGGGLGCALGASDRVLHAPDVAAVDQTPEGVRIQLIDQENRAMFSGSSAEPLPRTQHLLETVAKVVAELFNAAQIDVMVRMNA